MAVLEIPTRTDLSVYDFTIELDEVVYTISMFYNTRSARWYFSLLDLDGNPLREGLKLVSNWALTIPWTQQGRPDGELYATNAENDDDADRDTLGTQPVFIYDEGNAING
jgi:hypothetical protein